MQQFDYMQFVPRDPFGSASPVMAHKDVNVMFDDYLNHLALDDTPGTLTPKYQSVTYNYIHWYFRMPHPYMTSDALGYPLKPAHQQILQEEHVMVDHDIDMLPRYRCIMDIMQVGIDK